MSPYRTINPATGKTEKVFDLHSTEDMLKKLERAHGFWQNDWRYRSIAERRTLLNKAADALRANKEKHARLISIEMGKVLPEAIWEIELSADILSYYADKAETFLAPRDLPVAQGKARVLSEPLGVIYCVEPWNFPYYQLARVAAPNLMAGNVVMVKHAPGVPQCALAFEALFLDAGAPEGAYTNLFITNDQSETLIGRPEVRGVALTGSERAGSAVAAQAGRALKKSTMELGGSDAFIVLDDADLDVVVPRAAVARMGNNGQVCTAAKRMIVHHSLAEEFTARLKTTIEAFQYGDPLEQGVTHGPMSSEDAMKRAVSQVEKAVANGATLVSGGKPLDQEGFFMKAAILTHVTKDNPIFYEEIFGPVAIVYPVQNDEEAVALANDSPYGLGGSIHTSNEERGYQLAQRIDTGMVFINDVTGTAPDLPFGGIKNSGYGRELSEFGIEEFINRKLIRLP
ncbi:succinate-semialdehyde dehydrogenase [Acetobacter senegalensis]|uniref:Succinate-semialdehyde dehydrogenase n=2 Tax=Acetobacter TaxID=434 RepID=A0A0U5B736_9PROT|nr:MULTISPECIES: NAD-dependent succinate-semialdehyde dehydrogenase [Acetobacter]ATJ90643.1 succinate-semialdehyde dehydrogenase [Acetobacter tropicalis]KXV60691.1 succinate-semialdehyde dehydrogenase [Acetobacter senegalensis]MCC6104801.1 NAD-dependent succinate-semialdehyde dehydrogenase [Acetobacter sp.]MCP1196979.1 NAD-dependent succinate-semialdehyde dehydrogenase [Acetobacter senegalensis]MDN7352896.1 NAD-dependent succinate-semialdehyde dehydrogenase [Acetobacter senegalensis]